MNTFIIIAITILVTYTVVLCVANRGIPNSLSQSVFFLPKAGAWLWTAVIGLVAAAAMPTLIEKAPEDYEFLGFLSSAGLAFVAICPLLHKEDGNGVDTSDFTYKLHTGGAILCAVCSQILIACCHWQILLIWAAYIVAFVLMTRGRRWPQATFWAEMTCFTTTFIYCLS